MTSLSRLRLRAPPPQPYHGEALDTLPSPLFKSGKKTAEKESDEFSLFTVTADPSGGSYNGHIETRLGHKGLLLP